jgi:hypothetical protein
MLDGILATSRQFELGETWDEREVASQIAGETSGQTER